MPSNIKSRAAIAVPSYGTDTAAIGFYVAGLGSRTYGDRRAMEKVALLCILMAIIGILAERAPMMLPPQTPQ